MLVRLKSVPQHANLISNPLLTGCVWITIHRMGVNKASKLQAMWWKIHDHGDEQVHQCEVR